LKDEQNALLAAFDPKLSEQEQKNAFAQALRRAEAGHPAAEIQVDFYGTIWYVLCKSKEGAQTDDQQGGYRRITEQRRRTGEGPALLSCRAIFE